MATAPIALTGASGYIGSWIAKELLRRGFTVHATVRDPDNDERVAHLKRIVSETSGVIKVYQADLMRPSSFDGPFSGCSTVIHTASPLVIGRGNLQRDLIDPIVVGTRNVLDAVERASSVTRVVLTSTAAAMRNEAEDGAAPREINESDWNMTSTVPYHRSKVQAEREAWERVDAQHHWSLATINPGFTLGPSLTKRTDSYSIEYMIKLLDGSWSVGMPKIMVGVVDVRDVANAHVQAAIRPDAGGRHTVVAETVDHMHMCKLLARAFPDRPLPKRALPNALVYAFGPQLTGFSRSYIWRNLGRIKSYDNTKSQIQLGIRYRPLAETLREHAEQLIRDGLLP